MTNMTWILKTAAILDIFSCIVQGILPYGAQVLILSFANGKLDFFDLISNAVSFVFIRFYFSSYL
jgi:hypothetical protein